MGGRIYPIPAAGGCVNAKSGSTREGTWWMETDADGNPELTLNGADQVTVFQHSTAQVLIPAAEKLTFHVRGQNRILGPEASPDGVYASYAIKQQTRTLMPG